MGRKKNSDMEEMLSWIKVSEDFKQESVDQETACYDEALMDCFSDSLLSLSLTAKENAYIEMLKKLEYDISDQIGDLNIMDDKFLYKILRLGELSMSMRFIKNHSRIMDENRIMEKANSSDLSKHIIKALYEQGRCTHQQLADATGKKKSQITNKMIELHKSEFVNAEKSDSETWYMLTSRGHQFYIRYDLANVNLNK